MTGSNDIAERAGETLGNLRARARRVHCITNDAAAAFTANALLAAGAQPSLTTDPAEVPAFVAGADALLVNLGTLDEQRRAAIEAAVEIANSEDLPWVLDPVLVNRSPRRERFASALLERSPAVVRGNGPELETLIGAAALGDPAAAAETLGTVLVRSGARDELWDGTRALVIENGDPLMGRVTAMGCAAGALIAAFLALEQDRLVAAAGAVLTFGICGEVAAGRAGGPGTFAGHFLDALYALDAMTIEARARVREAR